MIWLSNFNYVIIDLYIAILNNILRKPGINYRRILKWLNCPPSLVINVVLTSPLCSFPKLPFNYPTTAEIYLRSYSPNKSPLFLQKQVTSSYATKALKELNNIVSVPNCWILMQRHAIFRSEDFLLGTGNLERRE